MFMSLCCFTSSNSYRFRVVSKNLYKAMSSQSSAKVIFDSPSSLRQAIRSRIFTGQTSGQALGYAQANLCILPREYAFDFLLFATRNPKSCPVLSVLEPGMFKLGEDIDIRTDVPKYRIYRDGVLTSEVEDISPFWREDLVTFVIGCSFSFEEALQRAGMSIRHIDMGRNVPM